MASLGLNELNDWLKHQRLAKWHKQLLKQNWKQSIEWRKTGPFDDLMVHCGKNRIDKKNKQTTEMCAFDGWWSETGLICCNECYRYLEESTERSAISGQFYIKEKPWPNDLEDITQGQKSSHATYPPILEIMCAKYVQNPSRNIGATEQTWAITDEQTDRVIKYTPLTS